MVVPQTRDRRIGHLPKGAVELAFRRDARVSVQTIEAVVKRGAHREDFAFFPALTRGAEVDRFPHVVNSVDIGDHCMRREV